MKKIFRNYKTLIIFVCAIVAIILLVVNIFRAQTSQTPKNDVVVESKTGGLKENGYYKVPYNPTNLQKDLYNNLSKVIEGYSYGGEEFALHETNEKEMEICSEVVKNFVADFYTWSNKSSSYDVGGMNFVVGNSSNFHNRARDTFYKDVDGYIAQYGRENLPTVKNVDASTVYGGTFYYYISDQSYFYTEAKWEYEETTMDLTGFAIAAAFKVAFDKENESWKVIEMYEIW